MPRDFLFVERSAVRWKHPLALFAAALMLGGMGVGYFYATSPFPPDQDAAPAVAAQEARNLNVAFALIGAGLLLLVVSLIWLIRMAFYGRETQLKHEAVTPAR